MQVSRFSRTAFLFQTDRVSCDCLHIAVIDNEADFDRSYLVAGIPQAVLIDRQGKVRLIRVGSGKKNARDLEQMIERLLSEPATAGG